MGIVSFMVNGFKAFAGKLLAIDSSAYPEKQFNSVREILSREQVNITSHDLKDVVKKLRKKHLVDEISVASLTGSLIISSEPDGLKQAITSAALYQYINSEINGSKTIMIKSNGWIMIVPHASKLYIVRADASLTETELKALADDVERFLAIETKLNSSEPSKKESIEAKT
jgi:hypothetical protein